MSRRRMAALGAVVALTASGCGVSLQSLPKIGTSQPGGTYPIHARFANVLNLPTEAQVRVGAQIVGDVSSISASDFSADVVLQIDRGVRIPVGTTAQIRFDNPLGDEYIILQPPVQASGDLAPGAILAEADTSTAPSVEDTFGALALFLNGGGINQLQTIISELNKALQGRQPQIRGFLEDVNVAVGSLANGRTAVDGALSAIDNLSTQLTTGGRATTISNGIAAVAPAISVLSGANGQFSQLLSSFEQLAATGTAVATQSGQIGNQDLADLLPVVQQLEGVENQIGPDLGVLASFEAETPKIIPGDYLQVAVTANVILPPGASEATPGSTGYPTVSAASLAAADPDGSAVGTLLAAGLL